MYFHGSKKLTTEKNHICGTFWTDAAVSENLKLFFFFFFFFLGGGGGCLFFPLKVGFYMSCKLSPLEKICRNAKSYVLGKIRKNILNCRLLKSFPNYQAFMFPCSLNKMMNNIRKETCVTCKQKKK